MKKDLIPENEMSRVSEVISHKPNETLCRWEVWLK